MNRIRLNAAPRLTLLVACCALWLAPRPALAARVNVIEIDNQIISPVTQQYISDAIVRSEAESAECLVIQLDTPGGLLESTRGIVKQIMNADVPVIVYVGPSGSRAGSAGLFITLSAHVAAMAPSTNIGAAHPVTMEGGGPVRKLIKRMQRPEDGDDEDAQSPADRRETIEEVIEEEHDPMSDKIINDTVAWVTTITRARGRNAELAVKAVKESFSVTETEAMDQDLVDLVAKDLPDLLRQANGREVSLPRGTATLRTAEAEVVKIPMTKRQLFLAVVTNPNVAYILMMLGMLGLVFEFTHPGFGFPGIAGFICLMLALYAFQALPVSYVAVALLAVGLALLVAEAVVVSHGLLAVGGIIALTLGSLMLFESPSPEIRVSLQVIASVVITISAIVLFVVQRAIQAQRRGPVVGTGALVGQIGEAATPLNPHGQIFVRGEYWKATSRVPVAKGAAVRVVEVRHLVLLVEPLEPDAGPGRAA